MQDRALHSLASVIHTIRPRKIRCHLPWIILNFGHVSLPLTTVRPTNAHDRDQSRMAGPEKSYDSIADLNLLSSPAGVGVPHVRRRLDAGNEFERNVSDSDQHDERTIEVLPPFVTHDDASHEDIDYSVCQFCAQSY